MNARRFQRFRLDSAPEPLGHGTGNSPHWRLLEASLDHLAGAFESRSWFPLSSLDVVAMLYHAMLIQSEALLGQLHMGVPVLGAGNPETYDLVVGAPSHSEDHRLRILQLVGHRLKESTKRLLLSPRSLAAFKPTVNAELILQVCCYMTGQGSDHRERIRGELTRLRTVRDANPDTRGLILFDTWGSLVTEALAESVASVRGDDPHVRAYLLQPSTTRPLSWRLLT